MLRLILELLEIQIYIIYVNICVIFEQKSLIINDLPRNVVLPNCIVFRNTQNAFAISASTAFIKRPIPFLATVADNILSGRLDLSATVEVVTVQMILYNKLKNLKYIL